MKRCRQEALFIITCCSRVSCLCFCFWFWFLFPDQQQVTSSTPDPYEVACPTCFSSGSGCSTCNFVDGPASSSAALTPTSLVPDESSRDQQPEDPDEDSCAASDVSDLVEVSGQQKWVKPVSGPVRWIQRQIEKGSLTPRQVVEHLLPNTSISPDYDNMTLWRLIVGMLSQPPKRKRLSHVRTIDDVVSLIRKSNKIIVLTGAGVSVSCGIPDFRSRDGIYARLSAEFPSLPDPQSMFDIHFFRSDPRPFFKFAKEIYPGQFEPSPSHKFIRMIEEHEKLLRNYTQNIDTLEQVCGIKRVVNCHGSFSTATCTRCGLKVDADQIKEDIFNQRIPLCSRCPKSADMAIMKPDIVFFGEGLSDEFHNAMTLDKEECDLLLVMGSSLKVRPVALIPSAISPSVPQVLINREPLNHMNFDVELLGDCDIIVQELCNRLGSSWTGICNSSNQLHQVPFSEDSVSSALLRPRPIDCFDSPSSTTTTDSKRELMQRRKERQSLAEKLPGMFSYHSLFQSCHNSVSSSLQRDHSFSFHPHVTCFAVLKCTDLRLLIHMIRRATMMTTTTTSTMETRTISMEKMDAERLNSQTAIRKKVAAVTVLHPILTLFMWLILLWSRPPNFCRSRAIIQIS